MYWHRACNGSRKVVPDLWKLKQEQIYPALYVIRG